ncbi:MAG: cytochrome c maturation protein CcmE [candidate division Zixibacteria bacterium]|nr:cytochrome c maturation protein CcmE [candidate division Zixibacteria bacterium]
MPKRVIIVLIIVVAFGGFMFSSLMRSCSPHVSFEKAKTGSHVQVFGKIKAEDVVFDSDDLSLSFILRNEEGETMPVVYSGVVPSNFEYAEEATCIGSWQDGKFKADKLLLKCPSKYEGEVEDDQQYEFYNEDNTT